MQRACAVKNFLGQERQQVRAVTTPQVARLLRATAGAHAFARTLGNEFDRTKTSVLTNRLGANATHLESVVLRRVVTGRGLHRTRGIQRIDSKVRERRVHHANINHLCASFNHAVLQRAHQTWRTLAHVTTDHHQTGSRIRSAFLGSRLQQETRCAVANLPRIGLVKRLGVNAADVVRLEDLLKHGARIVVFLP